LGQIAQLGLKEVPERLAGYLLPRAAKNEMTRPDLPKGQIAPTSAPSRDPVQGQKKLASRASSRRGRRVSVLDPEGLRPGRADRRPRSAPFSPRSALSSPGGYPRKCR
jgi:hypothetical protein